jgi:hypothetical protein
MALFTRAMGRKHPPCFLMRRRCLSPLRVAISASPRSFLITRFVHNIVLPFAVLWIPRFFCHSCGLALFFPLVLFPLSVFMLFFLLSIIYFHFFRGCWQSSPKNLPKIVYM